MDAGDLVAHCVLLLDWVRSTGASPIHAAVQAGQGLELGPLEGRGASVSKMNAKRKKSSISLAFVDRHKLVDVSRKWPFQQFCVMLLLFQYLKKTT